MDLILNRLINRNCHLIGHLSDNWEYVCDTLEFGGLLRLAPGVYSLDIVPIDFEKERKIAISSSDNAKLSFFNYDNFEYKNSVKIRKNNSNILACLVTGTHQNDFVMFESVEKILISQILKDQSFGLKNSLTIIEPQSITESIEPIDYVTAY